MPTSSHEFLEDFLKKKQPIIHAQILGVQGLKFLGGTAPAGHTLPSPQPLESALYPQDLKFNAHEN